MPTPLPGATAEQVIAAVEAAISNSGTCDAQFAAAFTDMPADRAAASLDLACELGLLTRAGTDYTASHPMAKLLRTPHVAEKAAVVRILLEQFRPFVVFREELDATGDASAAATRVKAVLDLTPHREDVKSTLLGLATFTGALKPIAGGKYEREEYGAFSSLKELATGATEVATAELQIRKTFGNELAATLSADHVVAPLANALRHASGGNAREAVVNAGNAVESFLVDLAGQHGVNIQNATGLNAKLERFDTANMLPKKIIFNGKYLGHIRNAADHGIDQDIGQAWTISELTGLNYVYVSVAFIISVMNRLSGGSEI